MKHHQTTPRRGVHLGAYRETFQRLEEALEGARQRNQVFEDVIESTKMTRARLALFGSAPK